MRKIFLIIFSFIILLGVGGFFIQQQFANQKAVLSAVVMPKHGHWFILHRKSNTEDFFYGVPGDLGQSRKLKTFLVKTGIPGERPTPLPHLLGRNYWKIVEKHEEPDNPETAPYFLTLDVPAPTDAPFGPQPYLECDGQCDWIKSGLFGLHGIASTSAKLTPEDPGSSGCIRHTDEDITYLYNLLDPTKNEIRYYIEDN